MGSRSQNEKNVFFIWQCIVQVDLFDVSDTYKVWAVLPEEEAVSMVKLPVKLSGTEAVVCSVADPRLPAFSHRLVLLQGISGAIVIHYSVNYLAGDARINSSPLCAFFPRTFLFPWFRYCAKNAIDCDFYVSEKVRFLSC